VSELLDLIVELVRIESVNPSLDSAGSGEGEYPRAALSAPSNAAIFAT